MESRNLGTKGICAIIKACASGGVSKLKFGDLELEFGAQEGSHSHEMLQTTVMDSKVGEIRREEAAGLDEFNQDLVEELTKYQTLIDDPQTHEEEEIAGLFNTPVSEQYEKTQDIRSQ